MAISRAVAPFIAGVLTEQVQVSGPAQTKQQRLFALSVLPTAVVPSRAACMSALRVAVLPAAIANT